MPPAAALVEVVGAVTVTGAVTVDASVEAAETAGPVTVGVTPFATT